MRCTYTNKAGDQCRVESNVNPETGGCFWHDPKRKTERNEARRRGQVASARNRAKSTIKTVAPGDAPARMESVHDAVAWASWAAWAVATGVIDGRTAREVGYNVRAFLAASDKAGLADKIRELQAAIAALQEQAS
jgi:hypothetical protein